MSLLNLGTDSSCIFLPLHQIQELTETQAKVSTLDTWIAAISYTGRLTFCYPCT